jgi:hypothetical protein
MKAYYYYYLLTAIGLMPGGIVYKGNIQSTRNIAHASQGISQYNTSTIA